MCVCVGVGVCMCVCMWVCVCVCVCACVCVSAPNMTSSRDPFVSSSGSSGAIYVHKKHVPDEL